MNRLAAIAGRRVSRRSLLKGAGATAVGLGLAQTGLSQAGLSKSGFTRLAGGHVSLAPASASAASENLQDILDITTTTEAFGVTFLGAGIASNEAGNFDPPIPDGVITILKAARAQEMYHLEFFQSLGGKMLDTVLINAGVSGPEHRNANRVTAAEIGALMFTNAIAPIRLARVIAAQIRPDSGVLAFTSSVMGSVSLNSGGHELYRASKAALNSLTRGLWGELRGRRLTMVSLHPGWVQTDMGGKTAPVSVPDSATGIVTVLEQQSGAHRHRFLDYTGAELAW